MNRVRQPIKYHGGKYYLAKKIIEMMPPHTRYLEAFSGGLSVLLNKTCEGISEYATDTNGELMNFWAVLANEEKFSRFSRIVNAIPFSQSVFQRAKNLDNTQMSPVDRAVVYFVKMRQSRQGLGITYATPTRRVRAGMNENVSAWLSTVDGLPEIHRRLRRVEILNSPAIETIKKLDADDFLVYCDPPYVRTTRSSPDLYREYEMSYDDHVDLLTTLAHMSGKFLLSGYMCDLYKVFESQYQWTREDFRVPNSASGRKSKEIKIESVWRNYA